MLHATLWTMLYLVHGDEPLLCAERAAAIRTERLVHYPDSDIEVLDPSRRPPAEVVASLTAQSLFSAHRIVTMRGVAGRP